MTTYELVGEAAEKLVQDQINQHSAGIESSLSVYGAKSAISVWIEVLRGIEELINLPLFQIDDDRMVQALINIRLDQPYPPQVSSAHRMLDEKFGAGVAGRFVQTVRRSAAIGNKFRLHGFEGGEKLRTVGDAVTYFQSRRRQIVAILYCMPQACRGTQSVNPLAILNIFLRVVEHSCVTLTGLYRHLVLARIYDDYTLTVDAHSFRGNYELNTLNESFLEPERVAITEVPTNQIDLTVLRRRLKVDPSRVFSVAELCNDLLHMEATFAEFKLGETAFGSMARFIVACSRYAKDEYHIEINGEEFENLVGLCGLTVAARRRLVYAGTSYVDAVNSFSPFIAIDRVYVTTVTLLSRFAYDWKTVCLNRIKRFQIRSGFIFEEKARSAIADQGFTVSDIRRIERKEFDVVATKDGVIYNVQCKNNFVDLARMEKNPTLFARYNRRLERYYEDALRKEEGREKLLKEYFGLNLVRHVVLSKFPLATRNPRIMSFREIDQFTERFAR